MRWIEDTSSQEVTSCSIHILCRSLKGLKSVFYQIVLVFSRESSTFERAAMIKQSLVMQIKMKSGILQKNWPSLQ